MTVNWFSSVFPRFARGAFCFFFLIGFIHFTDWLECHNKEITCLPLIHESPHPNQKRSLSKKLSVKKKKLKELKQKVGV